MSFKKNMLKWVQQRTRDSEYKMNIKGFKKDWKDGLAFLALLHSFDPALFKFSSFKSEEDAKNLKFAFDNAFDKFGIDKILDVDDITDFRIPDDILVITYLTLWYQFYAKNKGLIAENIAKAKGVKKKKAPPPVPSKKGRRKRGGNKETFDKMKLFVSKKNEERAKGNWNFLKDHVQKINIDFESVANDLDDEFGEDEEN